MKSFFTSTRIRLLSTLAATALALPLGWGELTGLFSWLSPFIMLNSVFLLKSVVLLNVLGVVVLVVSFFRKRWFCRFLCPVGFGCDVVSKLSQRKHFSLRRIPLVGRWLALLSLFAALTGFPLFILFDPMAIFNGFFVVFSRQVSLAVVLSFSGLPLLLSIHLFFPNIWCGRVCPLGGLFDEVSGLRKSIPDFKKSSSPEIRFTNTGRRMFIAGSTGLLAGIVIPRWLKPATGKFFRPPASVHEETFNTLCIRCGNCIKTCPTRIIFHHTGIENLTAWMTPEVFFSHGGYCLENCNLCGTVCPSGAISPFTLEAKKELFMGSIEIGLDNCLLTERTECDRCKAVCSYKAIEIIPASQPLTMKPVVDLEKCVGCGACAAVCPPKTIKMVVLESIIGF